MPDLVDKLTAFGEDIKDYLVVAMLLSSLPESYSPLITALESRAETELTLGMVKGKLIDEYKRRKGVPDANVSSKALRVSQKKRTCAGENKSCFFCNKSGHFKQDCFKYKNWKANQDKGQKASKAEETDEQMGFVCFSVRQIKGRLNTWYIDSGATSHMTNDEGFFSDLERKTMHYVTLAYGESVKISGIGSGEFRCTVNK